MKGKALQAVALASFLTVPAWPQNSGTDVKNAPIYNVTVIERTVGAVNYQYRSGSTRIDFKGTVLLPMAKGEADVESKAGRTSIEARFDNLTAPEKFGTGYLTYVLWAISPQGRPKNLGELIPGSSDHASSKVTTDLQAFGMIVTAEPYAAVRRPSDVVVLENLVRSDTIGIHEPITARYELLPRGHYTYTVPANGGAAPSGPKLSMKRYESTLEVYQAQNAVQIARSLGADRYAPEVMRKADQELQNAQQLNASKGPRSSIVMAAREAAQTAEDARLIALERNHADELAAAKQQAAQRQQALQQAQAEAETARTQQLAAQQLLERERAARQRAEQEAAAARAQAEAQAAAATPAQRTVVQVRPASPTTPEKRELRSDLLRQLNRSLPTRDTPSGLVVSVADDDFRGNALKPSVSSALSHVAEVLMAHPGITVEVEGYTDSSGTAPEEEHRSYQRALAVRDSLVHNGVPAARLTASGEGSQRPLTSNSTAEGREQNRRVEIVLSGDAIGTLASWDRSYLPIPRQ